MEKEKVLQALDYCTKALNNGANLCDNCPMMEAGCDEYREDGWVTIPRALIEEIYALLDPKKSEFTHVKYLN